MTNNNETPPQSWVDHLEAIIANEALPLPVRRNALIVRLNLLGVDTTDLRQQEADDMLKNHRDNHQEVECSTRIVALFVVAAALIAWGIILFILP